MKSIFYSLCKKLNGWNFTYDNDSKFFDFYSDDGKAILTMKLLDNGTFKLTDDVEYYPKDSSNDFKVITLNSYNKKLDRRYKREIN